MILELVAINVLFLLNYFGSLGALEESLFVLTMI